MLYWRGWRKNFCLMTLSWVPWLNGRKQVCTECQVYWCNLGMHLLCCKQPVQFSSVVQFSSLAQLCPTLCDPMNCSTPGHPVHHQLPEFTQTHTHRVSDAIQPSNPLSTPSPPAPNPSQHQNLPMSQLFAWGGQSTGVSTSASVPPKKSQGRSPS